MANGLPLYEVGKQYTIWMTPQLVNASTGVFSDSGSARVFNGLVNEHDEEFTLIDDNISPTDGPYSNPVTYEVSSTVTIREIATGYALASASGNHLRECLTVSYYQKIQIVDYRPDIPLRTGSTGLLSRAVYYVKYVGFSKNVPKQQIPYIGTFQTILVSDGAGGYVTNPSFDTTAPS